MKNALDHYRFQERDWPRKGAKSTKAILFVPFVPFRGYPICPRSCDPISIGEAACAGTMANVLKLQ
jgi:hypothetical protein